MPKPLQETALINEAAAADAAKSGRMLVQFISPGWGSSGYYSPEVLESAATDGVIPAGTQMFADHPTDAEDIERPVRSIKDLMAITTEAAHVSADGALVGEVQVVPAWRDLVETVKDSIGVSIRGSATDIVEGEAEGRRGGIIEGLVAPVMSVDFVTRPGRGGRVLSVLESARASKRAIAHGISEDTVNDTRDALHTLLRDAYGNEDVYVWVRDFDASTVWFEVEQGDDAGVYGQPYSTTDGAVALNGDRTQVRVVTTYVPATRPDSTNPTTEESEEDPMAEVKIEEAELARLRDVDGRVTTLESERDTEKARAEEAERKLADRDRDDRARAIVTEQATAADVAFTPLEEKGLLAQIPTTDDGALDEAAFTTLVTEATATVAASRGAGTITGFGGSPAGGQPELTEADLDVVVAGAFGRQVKEA